MKIKESIKHFFAQFGSTVILVGLCGYLVLQLTLGIGDVVDVEHTTYTTVQDTLRLDGYIFRDEKPMTSGTQGTNCYLVDDGERVSSGTEVAITYLDATDASIQEEITRIDRMIRILQQSDLVEGALTTDLSIMDGRIRDLNNDLLKAISEGNLADALRGEDSLWIQLNRRQALLEPNKELYSERISRLKKEKEELERSLVGVHVSVKVKEYGYFYHTVDGYENIFTTEALERMNVSGFEALTQAKPDEELMHSSVGKLIPDSTWHLVVPLDKRTASGYEAGKAYDLIFPYSAGMNLSMTLERKISQTDKQEVLLVFSSRTLPEGFDFARTQTVLLVSGTYSGIRVSVNALRMLDDVLGCYVLDGTYVVFKEVEILYRDEEYVVCAVPYDEVYENRENIALISERYLSLYDTVITSGSDLYVGKVLQ